MSNGSQATEPYIHERLIDGLTKASDRALGMGFGNRLQSDALLHADFIAGLRQAEGAARMIAHARGVTGQGIAWLRLTSRLGNMLDAATKSAALSVVNTRDNAGRAPRGVLWVKLGALLNELAEDARKATKRKSSDALVMLGQEFRN